MPSLDGSRNYVIVLLVLTAPVLAGCTLFENGTPNHHIVMTNEDTVPHDAVLVVMSGGKRVSTNTVRVAPNSSRTVSVINHSGRYSFRLKTNGERANTTVKLPVVEGDRRSFTRYTITKTGKITTMNYHED